MSLLIPKEQISKMSRQELSLEYANQGKLEEFFQKGDRHGNGRNYLMQDLHRNTRIEIQKESFRRDELARAARIVGRQ
jgi:prepilin-type processing-associated H-X9-DG protein